MSAWTDEQRLDLLERALKKLGPRLTLTWNFGGGARFVEIEDAEDDSLAVGATLRAAIDELLSEEAEQQARQGSLL